MSDRAPSGMTGAGGGGPDVSRTTTQNGARDGRRRAGPHGGAA